MAPALITVIGRVDSERFLVELEEGQLKGFKPDQFNRNLMQESLPGEIISLQLDYC